MAIDGESVDWVDCHRRLSLECTKHLIIVTFRDGSSEQIRVDFAKGHPHNPMSREEFAHKSADCARYAAVPLPDDVADRLTELVEGLDELDDIRPLMDVLAPSS